MFMKLFLIFNISKFIFSLSFGTEDVFAGGDGDKWVHFQKCSGGNPQLVLQPFLFPVAKKSFKRGREFVNRQVQTVGLKSKVWFGSFSTTVKHSKNSKTGIHSSLMSPTSNIILICFGTWENNCWTVFFLILFDLSSCSNIILTSYVAPLDFSPSVGEWGIFFWNIKIIFSLFAAHVPCLMMPIMTYYLMMMMMMMMPPSVVGVMADSGGPSNNWDQCAAGPIRHTHGYKCILHVTFYILLYIAHCTLHLHCTLYFTSHVTF